MQWQFKGGNNKAQLMEASVDYLGAACVWSRKYSASRGVASILVGGVTWFVDQKKKKGQHSPTQPLWWSVIPLTSLSLSVFHAFHIEPRPFETPPAYTPE